ncbi:MAG: hypothetical protein EAZ97_13725 [Bacteroidetes bacterium]|nr:MAG: hypothetical protein EAZ97_13725 [Bacteroidota bacterium]
MKNIILFVFFYVLSATFLQAQERIFVIGSVQKEYRLNDFTYFYADSANKISLEQIQKPIFSLDLYAKPKTAINPKTVYWYKITLTNQIRTQVDFALEIGNFEALDFYIFGQNQLLKTQKTGKSIPFSQRASAFKANIFPFTLAYGDTLTIIGKGQIQTDAQSYFTDMTLSLPEIYQQKYAKNIEKQLFFQGAMLLMFFYNLFFFFMVRDRAYLYYALYVLSMVLVSVEVYDWLQEMPYLLEISSHIIPLSVTLLYTQFIRYFLNIPQINPKINRYCDYWILGRMIFTLVIMLVYYQTPSNISNNNMVLIAFILDILLGLVLIYAAWKKNPILAGYMVMGYLAMTLPLSAAILKQVIFANTDPETDGVIVQIGVLVELITFSLGLGYRSKVAEKEKLQISEENRRIILEQNVVLEQKVTERTLELNEQKQAVEERNKHIMQNINYARRIQEAFLPKHETIQKHLYDFFILFKPRDVVSGDFYFVEKVEGKVIVAAIDCTGHGVSGAFMTMLGNEILHKLVDNDHLTSPDLLLNELHKGVRQALKQAETENHDGMDLSLVLIDKEKHKVEFAGAKNPLIYIQNKELTLLKADKMPIGGEQKEAERIFSKIEIELNLPTIFYLFSDGFQDQFGGTDKRKFTIAKMKTLFLEIHEKSMSEQKEILNQTFENWRNEGKEKQIDDVLVIGIRL